MPIFIKENQELKDNMYEIPDKLTNWYVNLSNNINILYDDFINYVSKNKYYDNNHFIVNLSFEDIKYLAKEYSVDMTTNERIENTYWGKTVDNGYNHSNKIPDSYYPHKQRKLVNLHHTSHSNGLSVDFAYAIYNQTNNEIKSKK